VQHMR